MKTYPIRYLVEFGKYTKEELEKGDWGGTDAVMIFSFIRGEAPKGPSSVAIITTDGTNNNEEMKTTEVFLGMTLLANNISNSPDAPEWQREIAKKVMDLTRDHMGINIPTEEIKP